MDQEGQTKEQLLSDLKALRHQVAQYQGVETALKLSEERYRAIIDNIEDGYYEVDLAGNLTFCNDALCRINGLSREELMGTNNRNYTDEENVKKVYQAYNTVYRTGKPAREIEFEVTRRDGTKRYIETSISLIRNSSGKPIGFRGIARDTTERKKTEELLRRLSTLDGLTGIPNRRYFDQMLDQEWSRARRLSAHLAIIMADIDFFKHYNDQYGHQAGDDCLRKVSQGLIGCLKRATDLAARYGGEEFVFILPGTDLKGASSLSETLRARVELLGIHHADSPVSQWVTISLGVTAAIPSADSSPFELIRASDQALYQAKREGRNRVTLVQG